MRRFLPVLIVAVGLAALALDFAPLSRPFGTEPCNPPALADGCIDTRLGLDLQGGLRGEYRALPANNEPVSAEGLTDIRTIIESRINQYGVAEPIVQTQGSDRIVVEIPGVTNEQEVRGLIGSTGRLDFIEVPPARSNQVVPGQPIPPDLAIIFSGSQIDSATAAFNNVGERAVDLRLKEEGARIFDAYAAQHFGEQFAIVLDGIVQSAPTINAARFGGQAQISGGFSTQDEVNALVTVLRYGALPNAIEEVSFSKISPTLGLNFLQQSLLAGAIGIALVFAFMLIHYRLPGVVACVALLYYALLAFAIFRLVPVTLTLAGVAAFVLSVGMAVDANILIFERTKEELRSGKTLVSAVEAGFNRAWNSIFDSNMSSIITAAILFYFGSAVIRGFALVLIIGVLLSMFTAIALSREVLRWVVRQPWARKASLFGVNEDEFIIATPRGRSREARADV
ncbi:protein translocase subunit SecD [soil metagenome]